MANTTWSTTDKTAGISLSGGNLIATATTTAVNGVRTAGKQASGKYYWEVTFTNNANSGTGIANGGVILSSVSPGLVATTVGCAIVNNSGAFYANGVSTGISFGAIGSGTIVCFALDLNASLLWVRVGAAGNWNSSVSNNPATGVGGVAVLFGAFMYAYPASFSQTTAAMVHTANFGDTSFSGAVPSGFTSGFTAGATPPLIAESTQVAAEQWINANADARMTSIFLEHWGPAGTSNPQAVLTQIALEHWFSVAAPTTAQARAWILA